MFNKINLPALYCTLLTLLYVLVTPLLFAQNMEFLKTITPPAPTAASLGKYADWPVSLYTGVPSINVPLYTAQGRRLSVPISLNYHASGIKVNEIASWVGLGFSLDAGGVITRSVVGLPDDNAGYFHTRKMFTNPGDMSSPMIPYPQYTHHELLARLADGLNDSEPDYYTFSALGKSYKFFFKGDGSIVTIPASNTKITCTDVSQGGEFQDWKVVMEDGTQLYFGQDAYDRLQDVQFGSQLNGSTSPKTSWYLTKIRSVEGEEVSFAYRNEQIEQSMSHSQTDYAQLYQSYPYKAPVVSIGRPQVSIKVLRKISTVTDSVIFETIPREDLETGSALQQLRIYSALTGDMVKKFLFSYTYSQAVNSGVFSTVKEHYKRRLKLMELKEVSPDNSQEKVWNFAYNPTLLPSRASYAQDHWGYFNNAIGNETLLPFDLNFKPATVPYANREADSTAVMAEMLTKITYPTGGYSEFNYESNRVLEPRDNYKTTPVELDPVTASKAIHIHKAQVITFMLEGSYHDYEDYVGGSSPNPLATLHIKQNGLTVNSLTIRVSDLNPGGVAAVQTDILLPDGDYTVELVPLANEIVTYLGASFKYEEYLGWYSSVRLSGGVRVKSIFDYDNQTSKTIKRFFAYEKPIEIHSITNEDYVSTSQFRSFDCGATGDYEDYETRIRFSSLRYGLGSIQGGPIGYEKVTTLYGEGGSNGKTVSYFSRAIDDFSGGSTVAPFAPGTDRSYKRGMLERQEEFTANGTLLKKQTSAYEFVNEKSIKALKVSYKFTLLSTCTMSEFPEQILVWSYYTIPSEQQKNKSTIEVNYFLKEDNTYDSIRVVKNFYYDTPENMQPTRTETWDSEERLLTTIQRTALEKAAIQATMILPAEASLAIDSLIRQNRLSEVLQTESLQDNVLLFRQTTLYKGWSEVNPSLIAPEKILLKIGTNPVETRALFIKYDDKGNLLEQQKVNDVKHSYLYNYSASKPVAEITNATHAQVAYTSFEADDTGNWTISSTARNTTTARTGVKSYSLSGGKTISSSSLTATETYRMSLWAKEGNALFNSEALIGTTTVNGWTYYEKMFTGLTTVTLSGNALIDEVRLYPSNATLTTATYEHPSGATSINDSNGSSTFYQYDNLNRLRLIKDNKGNIIKRIEYNYQLR